MSGTHDTDLGAAPTAMNPPPGADESAGSPWWRHLAVVLLLAALTRVGFYFAGLVAMLIVLTDLRRHQYTRLGGTLVLAWWTFLWGRSGVPPLIGFGLLGLAAGCFAVAAAGQPGHRAAVIRNAVLAAVAAALALLNIVPYGLDSPTLTKNEALERAITARRGDIEATHAQVVRTRERFDQRPVYLVLLFELNKVTAKTRDGEPCFTREEVHYVDGLNGAVDRSRLVDRLMLAVDRYQVATAREEDGNCLPLPRGTSRDIVTVPGR